MEFDFEFLEDINPLAFLFGAIGGVVGIFMVSRVETKLIFKILTPIATFIACYILTSIQLRD